MDIQQGPDDAVRLLDCDSVGLDNIFGKYDNSSKHSFEMADDRLQRVAKKCLDLSLSFLVH